ncbi:hypothetical protein AAVH_17216 [Aphelenchoides avenae]|nr:hypothetical protein AAVH_17216 [Aphelenchus avenae]
MVVTGATGSGKTEWLRRFLTHRDALIAPPPEHVLYCYGELNAAVMALESEPNVSVFYGVPDEAHVKHVRKEHGRLLVVLDDLMVNLRAEYLDTQGDSHGA